jgi:dTDP-glucose 4,6-dehydratase
MKRVLLTGIDGFIGHHLAEAILKETDWEIVGMSRIDGASTLHRLTEMDEWLSGRDFHSRVDFVFHDLRAPINEYTRKRIGKIDYILHLAASTHVDRSIECPMEFVQDNVVGTCNLLDFARTLDDLKLCIYFSTDEVFGPAPDGVQYKEWDRYHSGNPYSATKAAGEELTLAYANTYQLPAIISHTMNAFGERQHPEKFLPLCINKVLRGETIRIHSDRTCTKPGSRFYVHARNVASAVLFLMNHPDVLKGDPAVPSRSGKYNIVGEKEVSNLELAEFVAQVIGKPLQYELVDFHSSRPGHDLRYALDGSKLREMGYEHPKTFEESLEKTIRWYLAHPEWLLDEYSEAQATLLYGKKPVRIADGLPARRGAEREGRKKRAAAMEG